MKSAVLAAIKLGKRGKHLRQVALAAAHQAALRATRRVKATGVCLKATGHVISVPMYCTVCVLKQLATPFQYPVPYDTVSFAKLNVWQDSARIYG